MPRTMRCNRGHHWDEEQYSPAAESFCPVCGQPALALSIEHPADESTLLQKGFTPAMAPLSGDQPRPQLPDYEIIGELGRGGMGIVYKARQVSANRIVALKVIRKDRLQHEEAVRRFRREAQAAARLNHPNIVRVYDSDHTGDTHFLAMEYVDGLTLERLVEKQGPLPLDRACDFIRQAAVGLQHAHDMGLVHRDIKPSNLMATGDGGRTEGSSLSLLKVLDMGVARVLGSPGAESFSTLTQGGAVIGTADYVAPEQLEDPHGADIRADLYSLGCTFYFLLTGQVPFPGGSLISKLDKQRWQTPTSIQQLRSDVPPAVAMVAQKLMAKKPEDRYQSPEEVVRALETLARSGYAGTGDSAPLRLVQRLLGHQDAVWSVAFSPDGKLLATAGRDRQLLVWDAASGVRVHSYPKHPQEIRAVAFSREGDRLASASGITLRLFDAVGGSELRRFAGHSKAIKCVAFSPDGKRIASGGEDRTVRLWDTQTGREVQRFTRHTAEATCLAFFPDGDHLLSGGRDQTLRLWDLRSGQESALFSTTGGAVLGLALGGDARQVLTAHFDTLVRLWDLESGQELRHFIGHKQMVTGVALTGDGERFVSVSQDGSVRVWNLKTGFEIASSRGHGGGIHAVALTDAFIATASADRSAAVWELPR